MYGLLDMTLKSVGDLRETESELLTIEAGRSELHYWRDIWRYRELMYFFAVRDISVRYRQTLLGVAWVVVRPLLAMAIFTVVFGRIAGLASGGVPYPVMVLVAMLPWQLFTGILVDSGNSIVNNTNIISKVYFPRLIIPLSTMLVCLVDFVVSGVLAAILMAWYRQMPDWRILALPFLTALTLALAMGFGLLVAALNVRYRDFRFIVSFSVQFGLYISPIGFSSAIVPDNWRWVYSLNPMVGVIDGFRWALLGAEAPYWPGLLFSILFASVLLFYAVIHFRRTEKSFADDI
jgi:lipopolysaccharide transport system permease protein